MTTETLPAEGDALDCGHPCPHQYAPTTGTLAVLRDRAAAVDPSTWACTCGLTYAQHRFGTGYARTPDGRTLCYPCAEDAEARDFAASDSWMAYATLTGHRLGGRGREHDGTITTWTGRVLATITEAWRRYDHPSGHPVTHVRAVAPDGSRWYGRYLADWTQAVTLHRNKGGTRA